MNARTCFDILYITRDATLDEAKESYKRLVKLWHPDQYVNFPEKQMVAQEKLKEINIAYRDIVAILKHNPVENKTSSNEEHTQQQTGTTPRDRKKNRTTFWNHVIRFINTNILKSYQFEDTKRETHIPRDAIRHRNIASTGGGRVVPDFQQILKRTVRGKQPKGGGRVRNRHENMKRIRNQFRNATSYRVGATTKRGHGDRVEEITPVGRVNRIGGD